MSSTFTPKAELEIYWADEGSWEFIPETRYELPTPLELVRAAEISYLTGGSDVSKLKKVEELLGDSGWVKYCSCENKDDGYFGIAFISYKFLPRRLIIAHRGTVPTTVKSWEANVNGIMKNQHTSQLSSAATFVLTLKAQQGLDIYSLSITGHSLGGWLAQCTTFVAQYLEISPSGKEFKKNEAEEERRIHVHCQVFDSPGARQILQKIRNEKLGGKKGFEELFPNLDITNYVLVPNLVNSLNEHVGEQIELNEHVGEQIELNEHVGEQIELNAHVGEQIELNEHVGEQIELNTESTATNRSTKTRNAWKKYIEKSVNFLKSINFLKLTETGRHLKIVSDSHPISNFVKILSQENYVKKRVEIWPFLQIKNWRSSGEMKSNKVSAVGKHILTWTSYACEYLSDRLTSQLVTQSKRLYLKTVNYDYRSLKLNVFSGTERTLLETLFFWKEGDGNSENIKDEDLKYIADNFTKVDFTHRVINLAESIEVATFIERVKRHVYQHGTKSSDELPNRLVLFLQVESMHYKQKLMNKFFTLRYQADESIQRMLEEKPVLEFVYKEEGHSKISREKFIDLVRLQILGAIKFHNPQNYEYLLLKPSHLSKFKKQFSGGNVFSQKHFIIFDCLTDSTDLTDILKYGAKKTVELRLTNEDGLDLNVSIKDSLSQIYVKNVIFQGSCTKFENVFPGICENTFNSYFNSNLSDFYQLVRRGSNFDLFPRLPGFHDEINNYIEVGEFTLGNCREHAYLLYGKKTDIGTCDEILKRDGYSNTIKTNIESKDKSILKLQEYAKCHPDDYINLVCCLPYARMRWDYQYNPKVYQTRKFTFEKWKVMDKVEDKDFFDSDGGEDNDGDGEDIYKQGDFASEDVDMKGDICMEDVDKNDDFGSEDVDTKGDLFMEDVNKNNDFCTEAIDNDGDFGTANKLYDEDKFVNELRTQKVVILEGLPGMGKSTTITRICSSYKNKNPDVLVIKIEAKNVKVPKEETLNLVQIITDSIRLSNTLEKFVFEFRLNSVNSHSSPIDEKNPFSTTIFLDALDEIDCDANSRNKFLLALCEIHTVNLFISSRPGFLEAVSLKKIRDSSVLAKFVPLADYSGYFTNYWNGILAHAENFTLIDKMAKALVTSAEVHLGIGEDANNFLGISLHLRMLAEVYFKTVKETLNTKGCEEFETFKFSYTISSLYEKFIRRKFEIFFMEKLNIPSTVTPYFEHLIVGPMQTIEQFALLSNPHSRIHYDHKCCGDIVKSTEEEKQFVKKIGIFMPNGEFIHRTFAEYFVAKFTYNRIWKLINSFKMSDHAFEPVSFCKYDADWVACHWYEILGLLSHTDSKVIKIFINEFAEYDKLDKAQVRSVTFKPRYRKHIQQYYQESYLEKLEFYGSLIRGTFSEIRIRKRHRFIQYDLTTKEYDKDNDQEKLVFRLIEHMYQIYRKNRIDTQWTVNSSNIEIKLRMSHMVCIGSIIIKPSTPAVSLPITQNATRDDLFQKLYEELVKELRVLEIPVDTKQITIQFVESESLIKNYEDFKVKNAILK